MLKLFIEYGMPASYIRDNDNLALRYDVTYGHENVVKYFLNLELTTQDLRADNNYAHFTATKKGYYGLVVLLLFSGLNVSDIRASEGRFLKLSNNDALVGAAENGHYDVGKLLLRQGLNKKEDCKAIKEALKKASRNDHIDVVDLLASFLSDS